jgi:hypothetical protein
MTIISLSLTSIRTILTPMNICVPKLSSTVKTQPLVSAGGRTHEIVQAVGIDTLLTVGILRPGGGRTTEVVVGVTLGLVESGDTPYEVVIVGILRPDGGRTTEVNPTGPGGRMYQGNHDADVVEVGEEADTVGIGRSGGGRITDVVVGVIRGLEIVTVLETGGGEGKM